VVLTKEEFIASIQNEVRIFLHLVSKIDPAKLDYRPSAKQRSTLELVRYMTYMGPVLTKSIKAGGFDVPAWNAASSAAESADFDSAVAMIGKQSSELAATVGSMSEEDLRAEIDMFGRKASRGSLLVNVVLSGYAAYRTQLFLYLKACGREELNTYNLWAGIDGAM
jgi:hypothetical protein